MSNEEQHWAHLRKRPRSTREILNLSPLNAVEVWHDRYHTTTTREWPDGIRSRNEGVVVKEHPDGRCDIEINVFIDRCDGTGEQFVGKQLLVQCDTPKRPAK